MANSSTLVADRVSAQAVKALDPSDSSDTGSDVQGKLDPASPINPDDIRMGTQPGLQSNSDAAGAGERGAAVIQEDARPGADILPDKVQPPARSVIKNLPLDEFSRIDRELQELEDLTGDFGDEEFEPEEERVDEGHS